MSRPKPGKGTKREVRVEAQPLTGTRILVTRAKAQASGLSTGLKLLGAQVIEIPLIEIRKPASFRPIDKALRQIAGYDWLILTSINAVDVLFARLTIRKTALEKLNHLQVAAIGPATAKAISTYGLGVDVVPKEYKAESVVKKLRKLIKGQRVLLVRAKVSRDVIPNDLRKAGAEVTVVEAYEAVVPVSSKQRITSLLQHPDKMPHIITFTSSSTVKNFVALVGKRAAKSRAFANTKFASIGPVTSATLRSFNLTPHIRAKDYTMPGLIDAIVKAVRKGF